MRHKAEIYQSFKSLVALNLNVFAQGTLHNIVVLETVLLMLVHCWLGNMYLTF